MKIATKTGDTGNTSLLSGERVFKNHPIIEMVGNLDELSAAIGLAKVRHLDKSLLEKIQKDLIQIMGELSYTGNDYIDKFGGVSSSDLDIIDKEVESLEKMPELEQKDWALYGKTDIGAKLDLASKICRRAERSLCANLELSTPFIIKYINRLSDLLYLLARKADLQ